MKVTKEQLEDIRRASKNDVVGPVKLLEDVNADYESSKYVSMHDVVVMDTSLYPIRYWRLCWDVTQEDDPELLHDSLIITPVKPKVVHTIEYVETED